MKYFLVFRLYRVKAESIKQALEILRKAGENDEAFFQKEWAKEHEQQSGWWSGVKRQFGGK